MERTVVIPTSLEDLKKISANPRKPFVVSTESGAVIAQTFLVRRYVEIEETDLCLSVECNPDNGFLRLYRATGEVEMIAEFDPALYIGMVKQLNITLK